MNSVSVSKLAAACVNNEYLELLKKDPEATPPLLIAWQDALVDAAPGLLFHELVSKFIQALAAGGDGVPKCDAGVQSLWDYFYKTICKDALFRVAEKNAGSAGNLSEALREFCKKVDSLALSVEQWNRLFVASEYAINGIEINTSKGVVSINGRIDTLRICQSGLELVDYKLSQGANRDRDYIQIALYARLLKLSRHGVAVDGTLEYYHPRLFVTEIPNQELDRIFDERVLPVIETLAESWWDDSSPPVDQPENQSVSSLQDELLVSFAQDVKIPSRSLRTHTAVVGAAGSGKTWMAKVIAEEAILTGMPVLAIDPQGDLVQMIRKRNRSEIPDSENKERYDLYWNTVEPRVFTPGTTHAIKLSLDPIRLIKADDVVGPLGRERKKEEAEAVLTQTASTLVGLAKVTPKDIACHESFTFTLLRHLVEIEKLSVTLRELASVVKEPDSVSFPEDPDMYMPKTARDKFARSLFSIATGPSANLYEGGQALDLNSLIRPDTTGKVPLNIIYLNAMAEDQKAQFIASVATSIFRWMITSSDQTAANNLLFYLDEARDFLPAGNKSTPCKQPVIRLFSQGRKFGVGALICTQSPRSVDYNIFGNCSSKMIGRLEAAQDVDRVSDWFQNDGGRPSWLSGRVGAEKGTFVGRWPEQQKRLDGAEFKTRMLYTYHSDAWSPNQVETEWREFLSQPK